MTLDSYIENMERLIKELKTITDQEQQAEYLLDILEFTQDEIERL